MLRECKPCWDADAIAKLVADTRAEYGCNHAAAPNEIVAELFASTDEMPCCGRVCLPGAFTRMWVAQAIGNAIQQAVRAALAPKEAPDA